ncbi:EndoU domain-containing protein [Pseudomonas sp. UFMG81]|uniref:EndoU domain-containing protein n=1 Tax=Pseudomonas sp. UFMG81 TaxID=2745936 RepID=UPI00188EEC93|nr:EndoU domain-containing protein [Pseudomonas sp. UFMG81]
MKKTFAYLPVRTALASLAVIGSLAFAQTSVACPQGNSGGAPAVDQQHVFCGEVSGGAAKGLHSRPGGTMPNSAAVIPGTTTVTTTAQMPTGIYALNRFNITQGGQTREKTISTMFPDNCTQANVVAAIQNAYNNRTSLNGTRFTGPSGASCGAGTPAASFDIVGYLDAVGGTVIRTAYPAY